MLQLTRSATLVFAAFSLVLLAGGCKRKSKQQVHVVEEEKSSISTFVHVADPRASSQLGSGFYDVEQGSWRWTGKKFSVLLAVPENPAQKKISLVFKMAVPEPVIQQLKTVTLSATVNGTPLPPETYRKPGEYVFSRELDAKVLGGSSAQVDFTLDKVLPPGANDSRALGLVATSIGFDWK
ncbi:MAG: hypothetical protein LLG20_04345 [Acidobacteriales bacterium]|nr:hypothetical protein [Terriglobales bacterium]